MGMKIPNWGRKRRWRTAVTGAGDPLQQAGPSSNGGGSSVDAIGGGGSAAMVEVKWFHHATEGSNRLKGTVTSAKQIEERLHLKAYGIDEWRYIPCNNVVSWSHACDASLRPKRHISSTSLKLKKEIAKHIEKMPNALAGMATLSLADSPKTPVSMEHLSAMAALSLNSSASSALDSAPHSKVPVNADQLAGMAALSLKDQP